MRLDQEGEPVTIDDLVARFGGTLKWFEAELTHFDDVDLGTGLGTDTREEVELNGWARLYPAGLSTDQPVETKDGPFVMVVDGDLTTSDYIRFSTDDYVPGLIAITGDLRASAMVFELGVRIVVEGSAFIEHGCFGRWGDAGALLSVHGELVTPLVELDGSTPLFSDGGIRSVISNGLGWWEPLRPDIGPDVADGDYFRPELIDNGVLDLERAFAAAREGAPLFLPGVEESFPQRLEARPAVSPYDQLEQDAT